MLICLGGMLSNHNLKTHCSQQFARNKQQQPRPVAENRVIQRCSQLGLALKFAILFPAILQPRPSSFRYLTIHDKCEERFEGL